MKRLLEGLPRWQRNRMLAWRLCKTEHFLPNGTLLRGFVQLPGIQPPQSPFLLDRRPVSSGTGQPVCLEGKMQEKTPAAGASHRREAHHIHFGYGSGKLHIGKRLYPRRPGHFHLGSALAHCAGCKSTTGMERLDRRRTGQDHGAYRELGGSANAAEAHRPAGSGGMRGLLQSPPRLVLLPRQRRASRS